MQQAPTLTLILTLQARIAAGSRMGSEEASHGDEARVRVRVRVRMGSEEASHGDEARVRVRVRMGSEEASHGDEARNSHLI